MRTIVRLLMFLFLLSAFQTGTAEVTDGAIKRIEIQPPLGSGWILGFRSDGSAELSYGANMGDAWETAPDLFDLDEIEASLRPLLEEAKGAATFKSVAFVTISRDLRKTGRAEKVESSEEIRNLFSQAFENLAGVGNVPRFRELLRQSPPFGIADLDIRDNQTGPPLPMSLTLYMESNHFKEPPAGEDLSRFVIDRKAKALLDKSGGGIPSAKQPAVNEPESAIRWSPLVSILVVLFAGVSWLLFGKEKPGRS